MRMSISGDLDPSLRRLDVGSKLKIVVECEVTSISFDNENREFDSIGCGAVKIVSVNSHGPGGLSPMFERSVRTLRTMGTMG